MSPGESAADERVPIRWIYPIVGGIIAESLTIAFVALVVALTGHGGPGRAANRSTPSRRKSARW